MTMHQRTDADTESLQAPRRPSLRARTGGVLLLALAGALLPEAGAATWYLHDKQNDWKLLNNWYADPFEKGVNPAKLSADDEFDVNCNRMRTTEGVAQTFFGKRLILTGGAAGVLDVRSVMPNICVIPELLSKGGTVNNLIGGKEPAIAGLEIRKFENRQNTTFSTGMNTRGLDVAIGTLVGDGDLTFVGQGGGTVALKIASSATYTGKIYIADGCKMTFAGPVVSGGPLSVERGVQLTLDQDATVCGLTIAGKPTPPGVYKAADLSLGGTGRITVKPDPTKPKIRPANREHTFGVNLPGGGFGKWPEQMQYHVDPVEWDYFHKRGLNLIRLAFRWELMQRELYGELDPVALAAFDKSIALAAERGMKVILDIHNYSRYKINGYSKEPGVKVSEHLIGSPEVPTDAYRDFCKKLAAHFKDQKGLWAYDIMNEPHATKDSWPAAAQAGVEGIRQSDSSHYILLEGDDWASSMNWMKANANLDKIKDPANRIIYNAHIYFDFDSSGRYDHNYDYDHAYPNIGIDRAAAFVHWLKLKNAKGIMTEYGVPVNMNPCDERWFPVIDNYLAYLDENRIGGTYWAAGNCWSPGYKLQVGKIPGKGETAPIMDILEKYGDNR